MQTSTKVAIYNFVLRAGIGAGLAMAYLHISLAPLAQSVIDLDRYLFPVSLAKQYSFLASWRLPEREIELPAPATGYWQLPGGNDHQNLVLRLYQDALKNRGITDGKAIQHAAALLVHENEKLTTDRLGDGGHSFGICQKYLGKKTWATDYLKKHPEWTTVETQVAYCADRFTSALKKYKTVFRAVVEHNCPACAEAGVDAWYEGGKKRKVPYFQRVTNTLSKLSIL